MENLLYYIYVPIISSLIIALLHSINTRRRKKRRIFNNKASCFIKAFKPEVHTLLSWTALRWDNINCPTDHIIGSALDKHHAAITDFRSVLNHRQRRRLDKVWEQYRNITKFPQEFTSSGNGSGFKINEKTETNSRDLAIELIQKFFDIATPK